MMGPTVLPVCGPKDEDDDGRRRDGNASSPAAQEPRRGREVVAEAAETGVVWPGRGVRLNPGPLPPGGGAAPIGTASGVPAMMTCQSSQLHIGSFQSLRIERGFIFESSLSSFGKRP